MSAHWKELSKVLTFVDVPLVRGMGLEFPPKYGWKECGWEINLCLCRRGSSSEEEYQNSLEIGIKCKKLPNICS